MFFSGKTKSGYFCYYLSVSGQPICYKIHYISYVYAGVSILMYYFVLQHIVHFPVKYFFSTAEVIYIILLHYSILRKNAKYGPILITTVYITNVPIKSCCDI